MVKIKLKNIFEIKNGILTKKEFRNQFGHKIIYPKDIDELYGIDFENLENYAEIKNFYKNKLQIGDILLETKDPFRVVLLEDIYSIPECGLIASSNFIILRRFSFFENNTKFKNDLICAILKSQLVKKTLKEYTKNKLVINQEEVGEIDVPDLTDDEIKIISESLKNFYKRKRSLLEIKKEIEYHSKEDNKRLNYTINKFIK
ncbi:hypothetical protein [Cetobacterium somerae]